MQRRFETSAVIALLLATVVSACGDRGKVPTEQSAVSTANQTPAPSVNPATSQPAATPQSAAAERVTGGEQLTRFDLTPYAVYLSVASCKQDGCPLLVQLHKGRELIDSYPLPVLSPGELEVEQSDWYSDSNLKSWTAYKEDYVVSTTARVVQLAPGVAGLLVSQRAGVERMHLNHVLLVAREDRLVPAWKFEPEEDALSVTAASVAPGGRPGFVVLKHTERHEEGKADTMEASHAVWNPAAQTVELQALPKADFPIYILSSGVYSSLAGTTTPTEDESRCLGGLENLDGALYPALQLAPAFVGYVFVTRSAAEGNQRTLSECGANLKLSVHEYRGS